MPLNRFDDWDSDYPVWSSLQMAWAVRLTGWLNRTLPQEYRALPDVASGFRVGAHLRDRGGPPPGATRPFVFPDVCEVHVFEPTAHLRPVGVVVFARPTTKLRTAARAALVESCRGWLHRGVGLAVVDPVEIDAASVHDDVVASLGASPPVGRIVAAGYRPVRRDGQDEVEVWAYPLAPGRELPTVPLGLSGGPVVPLDLESTYTEAARDLNL
jgi:hypothetical protein